MLSEKTTREPYNPEYRYRTGGRWSALYHGTQELRTAVQVEVENLTKGCSYTVLVPTDGAMPTCTCRGYEFRGECRHLSGALGHLLREATPAAVSPAIIAQVDGGESAAEKDARVLAERSYWD
jgi:hypothetical protein